MWWTALKYILVGALFWLVGALFEGSDRRFVNRSEPAQLIVLQVDSRREPDGSTMYRPVFGLETAARPRPEYSGNSWTRPSPHRAGDIVWGRHDPLSGEMRSDDMMRGTTWSGRIAQVLGILAICQGFLIAFGVPELMMPLRVRRGR